jgi:hypothetical protein
MGFCSYINIGVVSWIWRRTMWPRGTRGRACPRCLHACEGGLCGYLADGLPGRRARGSEAQCASFGTSDLATASQLCSDGVVVV